MQNIAIHNVLPSFVLNKGSLPMLKDYFFDAKYPGDNFVMVDRESCMECVEIMYDTIQAVNTERSKLDLPVENFEELYLTQ